MLEKLLLLAGIALVPLMVGIVCFRGAVWCLERRSAAGRLVLAAVMAAAAAGAGYGLLRLSGLLIFPRDNTYSVNFFDASWRDEGIGFLQLFGGPLGGGIAALISRRRNGGR